MFVHAWTHWGDIYVSVHFDWLVQGRRNSSALAMEFLSFLHWPIDLAIIDLDDGLLPVWHQDYLNQ